MPPGAAGPYLALHSLFAHIGILTSCKMAGWGPPEKSKYFYIDIPCLLPICIYSH